MRNNYPLEIRDHYQPYFLCSLLETIYRSENTAFRNRKVKEKKHELILIVLSSKGMTLKSLQIFVTVLVWVLPKAALGTDSLSGHVSRKSSEGEK